MKKVPSQNLEFSIIEDFCDEKIPAVNNNSKLFLIVSDENRTVEDCNVQHETDVKVSPRLISLKVAAKYCGLSPGSFKKMVGDNRFPHPIELGRRRLWDIKALDKAIDEVSGIGSSFDPIMEQINAIH